MRSPVGRAVLAFLLLSQLATIIGLVLISRHEANQLVDERSAAVLRDNAADAAFRLENHLRPAEALLGLTANVMSLGVVEPDSLEQAFRQSLIETPQLAGAFVGDEEGNFFYVSRVDGGIRVKDIDTTGGRRVTVAFYDDRGILTSELELEDDPYDPRERPWFRLAHQDVESIGWTEPYVFFTSQQPGITASKAIIREGESYGVVGVDIELGSLSDFLVSLRPAANGEAAIVDGRNGSVLAASVPTEIETIQDGPAQTELSAAIDAVVNREAGVDELEYVNDDGETTRVAMRDVGVGQHEWTIMMMGTEEEVVGALSASKQRDRTLQLLAGASALIVTIAIAAPILRPIRDLERQARTDVLTKLPNRRSIMKTAAELSSSDSPHALAMIDVDRFKKVNDRHGHAIGDEVLCQIAVRLADSIGINDRIGRVGGEEFVALLLGDWASAQRTAERMISAVRDTPIETSSGAISVTVSIGLANADGSSDDVQLLNDADSALMTSKALGRDRLTLHGAAGIPDLKSA